MAPINFPTTPIEGYVLFKDNGSRSYIYKSGRWRRNTGTASPQNLFVNPAFQINEQNGLTDASNVNTVVMAEQYYSHFFFTNGGVVRQQRVISPTPGGSSFRLRYTCTTAGGVVAANDWLVTNHTMEAWRMAGLQWGDDTTYVPKFAVVRFGWRSPAGTYAWGFRNASATEGYAWPFTITAAQANTDTVQVVIIPPNKWEVWVTGAAYWGSSYWSIINGNKTSSTFQWTDSNSIAGTSMTNTFMQTVGNVVELFDVGFYIDPNITGIPPEFEVPKFEDDLRDSQRYWQRMFGARGVVATAAVGYTIGNLQVPMRVAPAASIVGAPRMFDNTVAPPVTSVSHIWSDGVHYYFGTNSAANNLIPGRPAMLLTDGTQYVNYVALTARM